MCLLTLKTVESFRFPAVDCSYQNRSTYGLRTAAVPISHFRTATICWTNNLDLLGAFFAVFVVNGMDSHRKADEQGKAQNRKQVRMLLKPLHLHQRSKKCHLPSRQHATDPTPTRPGANKVASGARRHSNVESMAIISCGNGNRLCG